MSLKTTVQLKSLDNAFCGEPFCAIVSKSPLTTSGLNIAFNAEPFFAPSAVVGPGPGGAQQFQPIIAT